MKHLKKFLIIVLVLSLSGLIVGEKRKKPREMDELTNPKSPSFVPIPYPKNKKEVIEDLEYAVNYLFNDDGGRYLNGKTPFIRIILLDLLRPKPIYKVGKVVKVKNRSADLAHDYTWLLLIMDGNNDILVRVVIQASGLFGGAMASESPNFPEFPKYKSMRLKKKKSSIEILALLSETLQQQVSQSDIKQMEQVAFPSPMGAFFQPMWEIHMKSGKTFYFSHKKVMFYEAEDKMKWKKNERGIRPNINHLVWEKKDFIPDTINDQILVLKKLKKK